MGHSKKKQKKKLKVLQKNNKYYMYKCVYKPSKQNISSNEILQSLIKSKSKKKINFKGNYNEPNNNHNRVGLVTGLYVNVANLKKKSSRPNGGTLLIKVNSKKSKHDYNELEFVGTFSKKLTYSIMSAFSIAMKHTNTKQCYKYNVTIFNISPSLDGSSAGGAFTIAFLSCILNRKINNNVALTGKIELDGRITAVGGIIPKIIGAKHAGIRTVLIPRDNRDDFKKAKKKQMKEMNGKHFDVRFVNSIHDVINHILL